MFTLFYTDVSYFAEDFDDVYCNVCFVIHHRKTIVELVKLISINLLYKCLCIVYFYTSALLSKKGASARWLNNADVIIIPVVFTIRIVHLLNTLLPNFDLPF